MWRDAKELWEEERGMGEGKGKAARWGDTGSLSLALGSQPLCHCLAASELSGGGGVPKAHPHYGDCPQHWLCLAPPGEAPPARPQSRCGGTDLWQPPRPGGREGLEGPASLRGHRILLPSPWLRLYLGRRLRLAFTPPPPPAATHGHTDKLDRWTHRCTPWARA